MSDLGGKVALVTGGSTGIGLAAALAFARRDAAVAVNYSRNDAAADKAVGQLTAIGIKALAVKCDVSDGAGMRAMVDRVARELGSLDYLVNNAGWTKRVQPHSDLESLTDDVWDRVWAVNVARALAPAIRVNAVAPGLVPTGFGGFGADDWGPVAARTPIGRLPSEADLGAAIVYAATAEALTGQTIVVDSGLLGLGQ